MEQNYYLFEKAPFGIIYQNNAGDIVDANDSAARILGLSKEELKGRGIENLNCSLFKEDGTLLNDSEYPPIRALKSGEPINNEVVGVRFSGDNKELWLKVHCIPEFKDGENRPFRVYTIIEDVTEYHKWKANVLQAGNMERALIRTSKNSTFIVREGKVIYVNPALLRFLGYAEKNLLGKKLTDFVPPQDVKSTLNIYKKRTSGESVPINYTSVAKTQKGDFVDVDVSLSPVVYDNIPAVQVVLRDISKRKIAESELLKSEMKFKEFSNLLPEIVFEVDSSLQLVYANKALEDKTGISLNDFLTHKVSILDLLHENDRARLLSSIEQNFKGTHISGNIFKFVYQDKPWYLQMFSSPVYENSKITGLRGIAIDITEAENRQKALNDAQIRIKAFFNANKDLMFIKDSQKKYLEGNDALCRFFDKPLESIIGRDDRELALCKEIEPCSSSDKKVLNDRVIINHEEHLGDRLFDVTKFPIFINNDILIGGILHDITHQSEAEEELQMKDDAIHSSINAIIITNLEGVVIYVNDAAERLWKNHREDMIGISISEFCLGDGIFGNMKIVEDKGYSRGQNIGKRKDGSIVDLQYSSTLVRSKERKPAYVFNSFIDISKRIRYEKLQKILLNISQKSVSDVSLKDFIENIHEQIKTILTADNFYIALYHKDSGLYNFPYYVDAFESISSDEHINMDGSLTNFIRKSVKGQIISNQSFKDISHEEGLKIIGEHTPNWVWMGAPLTNSYLKEVIGVLAVQNYDDNNAYSQDDLLGLEIIAGYIGQFIERLKSIEELKSAKRIAQESEMRYRALFNDSASVMLLIDTETGNIVDANHSACNYYGYNYKKLTSLKITQINIFSEEEVRTEMIRALNDDRNHFFFKHRLANGQERPVEVYSNKVIVNNKSLLYSIVHDITQRKEAEERVRKLSASIEQSPVISIITDLLGNILYVNKAFSEITGYEANEALGKNPRFLQSGKVPPETYKEMWSTVLKGETWTGEFINLKKNGQEYVEKATISQIRDENGEIAFLLATKEDITEKKQAFEEIARLYKAIQQSPEPIALTDLQGYFIYVNPRYCELSGYSEKELLKSHTRILKSGRQPLEFYTKLWNTIVNGEIWSGEIVNKKKNGELFIEEVNIAPVLNDKGITTNYLKVSRDVTRQRKMVKELVVAKEKAEESDRLKSAFLANMSHEIRTPMNGIIGFTSLLGESDFSDADKKIFIESIQKSGERMLNTVNDIIEISKIEVGEVTLRKKTVNINDKISEIVNFFLPEASRKGLGLDSKLPISTNRVNIETDESKFESIVTNLIKNAIKYSDQGNIEFGYGLKADSIEFYCKDDGIGVPADRLDAIFNRFEQADIDDKRVFQGSGLGLSITKAYVEMLDGEIWVESVVDKGSVFYFSLPVVINQSDTDTINETETHSGQRTMIDELVILVAEDDEVSVMYLETILQNKVKKMYVVGNGNDAIEQLKLHPEIDVILMDIQLPAMDGYTATREIRKFNSMVKIIAQTAYALEGDREKALASGCDNYISKPINKQVLLDMLHAFCGIE